jgi:hypothetical protein
MKFAVVPLVSQDSSLDPAKANFKLPAVTSLGPATNTRQVSLNDQASNEPFGGPIAALLGTPDPFGPIQLGWADPITENPALNSIEIWEMYNFTEGAHPSTSTVSHSMALARPAEAWETGLKDTVIAYPGEITRVKVLFDLRVCTFGTATSSSTRTTRLMRPYFIGPLPQPRGLL